MITITAETAPELRREFEEHVMPEPNSGCWLWTGSTNWRDLRAVFKGEIGARFSFRLYKGPIPSGAMICHTCDVSLCVNPDHLYDGTNSSNQIDAVRRGRHNSRRYPEAAKERAKKLAQRNVGKSPARPRASIIPHADIPLMLQALAGGARLSDLGRRYGVTKQAVAQFLKRAKARATLTPEPQP